MLLARVFAAALKPAIAGSVITASAAGAIFALDRWHGDDATAFQSALASGQRIVISEFGIDEDAIVAIDPADAGDRETIARIDHAPHWGIFASLSPDGASVAYTALPTDEPKPSAASPAIAGVVRAHGEVLTLANDIDLLIAPVWSLDGESIVVRRNTPAEDSAGKFELILLGLDGTRGVIVSNSDAALFPIAFAPGGSVLYYATLSASGTDLRSVAADGGDDTLIAHLSDDIARDWVLSPDGASMAYTVTDAGQTTADTRVLDLASGVDGPAAGETEFNPAWSPAGDLVVASVGDSGALELPLSYAPDGAALAVRAVEGVGHDITSSRLELVSSEGERARLSDNPDALIVGWMD